MSAPHPPPQIDLRLRQREALRNVTRHYKNGVHEQLVVLPTGYGKTLTALFLASCFKKTLFMCPSLELEDQTLEAWKSLMPGIKGGRIKGKLSELDSRLVVSTPQTLANRLHALPRDTFDLVVVDEAHHAGSREMVRVIEHFQHTDPKVGRSGLRLGLTATPERYDGVPLDRIFQAITYSLSLRQAVEDGVLARPIGLKVSTRVSLEAALRGGDYDTRQLEKIVNIPARNNLIAETWERVGPERLTVAFCASIEHARDLAATFVRQSVRAEATWGDDPERRQKILRLRLGITRVLCNCNVLSEGFDCPEISCVLMTGPTRSRTRFSQQAGRGLRLFPGKKDGLIVLFQDDTRTTLCVDLWDFVGAGIANGSKPDLFTPEDLMHALEREEKRILNRESLEDAKENLKSALGHIQILKGEVAEVDLLKPPPEEGRVRAWSSGFRDKENATVAQCGKLKALGFDSLTESYTRADAHALIAQSIASQPAGAGMLERLSKSGYDTARFAWTHGQAEKALLQELTVSSALVSSRSHSKNPSNHLGLSGAGQPQP